MQTEINIPASERFLVCNHIFSPAAIKEIKADVKKFMADREKDESYWQFMNWKQETNEIVVFTIYAFADFRLPKKFDTIFNIERPAEYLNIEFTITQAVFNGWMPYNEISHGHKHVMIIQFESAVPEIIKTLSVFYKAIVSNNSVRLGFCNNPDFAAIQSNLTTRQGFTGR